MKDFLLHFWCHLLNWAHNRSSLSPLKRYIYGSRSRSLRTERVTVGAGYKEGKWSCCKMTRCKHGGIREEDFIVSVACSIMEKCECWLWGYSSMRLCLSAFFVRSHPRGMQPYIIVPQAKCHSSCQGSFCDVCICNKVFRYYWVLYFLCLYSILQHYVGVLNKIPFPSLCAFRVGTSYCLGLLLEFVRYFVDSLWCLLFASFFSSFIKEFILICLSFHKNPYGRRFLFKFGNYKQMCWTLWGHTHSL